MKLVTAIILSSFLSTVYSEVSRRRQALVYILEENNIRGFGVCVKGAKVIVHESILKNEIKPVIYISSMKKTLNTVVIMKEGEFALLQIVGSIYPDEKIDLETITYVPIYDGPRETTLRTAIYELESCDFNPYENTLVGTRMLLGKIKTIENGIIYIEREEQSEYEKESDPLFVDNTLFGLLIKRYGPDRTTQYQDIGCLTKILYIVKNGSPKEGDPNYAQSSGN